MTVNKIGRILFANIFGLPEEKQNFGQEKVLATLILIDVTMEVFRPLCKFLAKLAFGFIARLGHN